MKELYSLASKFKLLYRIPPGRWLLIAEVFLVAWTLIMCVLVRRVVSAGRDYTESPERKRRRKTTASILNLILTVLGLAIIVLVTFVRRRSSVRRVMLLPLRPLYGRKTPGDYWHVMIMNLVLYVPFACGLTFCLERSLGWFRRRPTRSVILICLLLSVTAELLQYFCGSGFAELDDVLMNTLGAVLGTIPYMICRLQNRIAAPLGMGR